MGTSRIQYHPPILREIIRKGLLDTEPFVLFDIGASGGIEQHWMNFGESLQAYGFDPLKKEIDRLNQISNNHNIRYIDAFVGANPHQNNQQSQNKSPPLYYRLSCTYAQNLTGGLFTQRYNNGDPDIVYSEKHLSIDSFCDEWGLDNIDFIKIDTDGDEYEVLIGAEKTLRDKNVLGVFVECPLHGPATDTSNVFSNIDHLLRSSGFSLFDMEFYRYTRSALPGKFQYDIYAQTLSGQVIWGDVLYLIDYAAESLRPSEKKLSLAKQLKLLCLFELYGLYDCAAELLLSPEFFPELPEADRKHWLDCLARMQDRTTTGYEDLIKKFRTDPSSFFPNN